MAEQDLEYLMEKNPHLSRRDILKLLGMVTTLGAFAACAPTYSAVPNEDPITLGKTVTPGGQSIKRRGPDLFEVHTNEFSDYARHRRKNTTGGIDFNIRDPDIFPVAEGIVTEVKTYEDAGLMVRISHGWLSSKYAHLQEEFVDPGQHVSRTDKIAIGGQTGSGAKTGHHLHLGIYTLPDIVQILNKLFNLDSDDIGPDGFSHFNPVRLAPYVAYDRHGNRTLPYWNGQELDGQLDLLYSQNVEANEILLREILGNYKKEGFERIYGVNGTMGQKMMVYLFNTITSGKHPFAEEDALRIRDAIKNIFSFPPLLTAPQKNPEMPELYKA